MEKINVNLSEVNFEVICKCCNQKCKVFLNQTRALKNPVLILQCLNENCGENYDSLIDGKVYQNSSF